MKYFLSCLSVLAFAPQIASADNIADCEIVLMETIEDESGRGGAKVASYRPATEFMESIYVEDQSPLLKIDELNIQAVMCKRTDIIPTKKDFKIVATGIPFFLSQSFESKDTDLVTVFFKEGRFQHVYTGPGLSEETVEALETRLAEFTEGEHDLAEKEAEKKKLAVSGAEEAGNSKATESEEETSEDMKADDAEISTEASSDKTDDTPTDEADTSETPETPEAPETPLEVTEDSE